MKTTHDLSKLSWSLTGYIPWSWHFAEAPGIGKTSFADEPPVPAKVPGSVQAALRDAGVLPNWNVGMNSRQCEWVESRHWIYETTIPDDWATEGAPARLVCNGLDYAGWVRLDGKEVGAFTGSFIPHAFDLGPLQGGELLEIIFDCPPRWLGQLGHTSRMTDWKPRFNYTWDWTVRLVQTGIWDTVFISVADGVDFDAVSVTTDYDLQTGTGSLRLNGTVLGEGAVAVRARLTSPAGEVFSAEYPVGMFRNGVEAGDLAVDAWYPNGHGPQPLYDLTLSLVDERGRKLDTVARRVGFKHVEWRPCEGAPAEADPWICVVNGEPVFLQGVNWTPILPNFADTTDDEYRLRLEEYARMGCTIMRVWGGAYLEKETFYELCDELGLLVWQEFPLSSSGVDNWPPEDEKSIEELAEVARSYVLRRQHHASLLMWCGGNELQGSPDGGKEGMGLPVDLSHPLLRRFDEIVRALDPGHRFVATSSSGPRFGAEEEEFGKGVHWDVHGPWKPEKGMDAWERYWAADDALFRSEVGAPGASPVDVIRETAGELDVLPGSFDNALWRRTSWWIEWQTFIDEQGHEPESLEEYVEWSQARQAKALGIAAAACKGRFPRCGGFIVWMGHDCFPCTANTAVLDVKGRRKPVANALEAVFLRED